MSEFTQFGRDIMTIVIIVASISVTIGIALYLLTALNNSLKQLSPNASIPNYLSSNQSLLNTMVLMVILGGVIVIAVWIIQKFAGSLEKIIPK